MNFQHLKYFLTVAEELNITRAAERLYISQQSLSNHIANLERELDVKLFTRSPKLSLTYAGGLLVDTATEILDLHRQYLSKVGDINKQYVGALRVGISHTCGLAEEVRKQFAQGADIRAFEAMPFVLIKRGNRTRSIVDQYFRRYYFKPQLILETENTVTTLAMALAGVGVTICPELFLRALPTPTPGSAGVDLFPLTDPSTYGRLVAGYREGRCLPNFGQRFVELTQEMLRK